MPPNLNYPAPSDAAPAAADPTSAPCPRTSVLRPLTSVLGPLSSGPWLALAAFALLWLDLCRQLSYEWSTNEQYAYGWFVPILALGLFAKKWPTRPPLSSFSFQLSPFSIQNGFSFAALRPPTSGFQLSVFSFQPSRFTFHLSAFILLLLLLPLRLIHETNQDWPLISWPLTVCVVGISLYAVYLAGGWSWVKHFAFPVCFILVAVQWPYRIEHSLTQGLMRLDTNITVELLGWLNIPAMQHGNVIELATGTVGVDEACSGIRSFQSTLMAGLFLGELYLLRPRTRLLLVTGGLALAFCFNVVRTLFLAWHAASSGPGAIDKWHDPAGFTITIACSLALWLLAAYVKEKTSSLAGPSTSDLRPPTSTLPAPTSAPAPSSQPSAFTFHPSALPPSPALRGPIVPSSDGPGPFSFQLSAFSIPRWFSLSLALWVPLLIVTTEAWYRSHDTGLAQTAHWWVNLPTNSPSYVPVPISASARKLLKYDEGTSGFWDESDGTKWSVFCFRWRAGDPTARMSAQGHRPEYCMTGSGHQMNADLGVSYLPVNGLKLPFRSYIFDAPERPLHVFFCLWEDGAESQVGFGKSKQGDRLRSVLNHRRGLGQQTIEIICSGYGGIEQARTALTARLPELIKLERSRSVASHQ